MGLVVRLHSNRAVLHFLKKVPTDQSKLSISSKNNELREKEIRLIGAALLSRIQRSKKTSQSSPQEVIRGADHKYNTFWNSTDCDALWQEWVSKSAWVRIAKTHKFHSRWVAEGELSDTDRNMTRCPLSWSLLISIHLLKYGRSKDENRRFHPN